MSPAHTYRDSCFNQMRPSIQGISPQYTMESAKGDDPLTKKSLHIYDEPSECPQKILKGDVSLHEGNLNVGGESSEYLRPPRRLLEVNGVSNGNSNIGKKSLNGRKIVNDCDDGGIHHIVRQTLELFRETLWKCQQENNEKPRIERCCSYTIASNVLKRNEKWLNTDKCLGFVPGVEIGDEFLSKTELRIVGLHHRRFCGIDYLVRNGVTLATSVVATERYANKIEGSNVLLYIGEGGNPLVYNKHPLKDQKLARGNLALKNSIEHKTPVRVTRQKCSHRQNVAKLVYVYEGLYLVESYRQYRGKLGKLVFEFLLRKICGQPNSSEDIRTTSKNTIDENERHLSIYENLERDVEKSPFVGFGSKRLSGCSCVDGCFEGENCLCNVKNGGTRPYDYDGCLVRKMPYIYECGLSCKCYSSCMNRVCQRGTQAKLELFKKKFSRYGVRSKSYILKGSFICKYVARRGFLGKEKPKETNNVVTMDVSKYANVGRFIGNSSSPNLYGQEIIFGHEGEPHMMLFAMRDISPLEELTIGYKNQILNN